MLLYFCNATLPHYGYIQKIMRLVMLWESSLLETSIFHEGTNIKMGDFLKIILL